MLKTLALALAVTLSFSATACMSQGDDDELVFDSDAAKADVVRPVGVFRQDVTPGKPGVTMLRLNADRTYQAVDQVGQCLVPPCEDTVSGTYRFASSHGKRYIVLYSGDDIWSSFEYKLSGDKLQLRYTGTDGFFTMQRTASLELGADDNGGAFEVGEGGDVVLKLASNGTTGYQWKVTETDRTFGYPDEDFEATGIVPGSAGGGGTLTLTWQTVGGPSSYVGEHHVKLEYRRAWEDASTPPADTYEFTVDVQP